MPNKLHENPKGDVMKMSWKRYSKNLDPKMSKGLNAQSVKIFLYRSM